MIRAWVFDTDAPFLAPGTAPSAVPPETRMAGLTLLRRAILMAWRAGAERVAVIARDDADRQRWAESEKGLPVPLEVISSGTVAPDLGDADRVLLLSALILPDRELPQRLTARSAESDTSLKAVAPGAGVEGPAVIRTADLQPLLAGATPAEAAAQALRSPATTPLTVDPSALRHLHSAEAVRQADRSLYEGLTCVADGYIDRVFNRPLSRYFTRAIINLPITPNGVTWLHFSLGLFAVWLFWGGVYWQQVIGAVLLQLSVALDCSDGEVARLKYQFSKFGSWLDVWADTGVTMALFVAVAKSAATELGPSTALALGALSVTGVLMCIIVIYSLGRMLSRREGASRLAATSRLSSDGQAVASSGGLVDAVINEATSRDFTVLIVFFALIGRLEWVAWLAGIGSHLFWMIFAGIQLSMLRNANAESR